MFLINIIAARLAVRPDLSIMVIVFFSYSLLGYVLECVWLSIEHKRLVLNRGFVRHLPFCIIYGFGALTGYAILSPLVYNKILLFVAGAIGATAFEFIVAQIQIRLFGDFWWDYTKKPLNYKGILCLESTIGWGFAALFIVLALHNIVVGLISKIPYIISVPIAIVLVVAYIADFAFSAYEVKMRKNSQQTQQASTPAETEHEMPAFSATTKDS